MKFFILLFLSLLFSPVLLSQSVYPQNATIQLDENGEASIVPTDVLVNLNGKLHCYYLSRYKIFEYNHTVPSLTEIFESQSVDGNYRDEDINPINKKSYASGVFIDCCYFYLPTDLMGNYTSYEITTYYADVCYYASRLPDIFTFDSQGILYTLGYSGSGLEIMDTHSNIITPFTSEFFPSLDSRISYDFDNHRLIVTKPQGANIEFYSVDISTANVELLFTIPKSVICDINTIEYIGNNVLLANGLGTCDLLFQIDLQTELVTAMNPSEYFNATSLTFIENDIDNVTLSQSEFTCNDLGENVIDITYTENGQNYSFQSTVKIVSDFSVQNCPPVVYLSEASPGSTDAIMEDFTTNLDIVSSCSSNFTITQVPAPGTLVPYTEIETVLITITDEFNNETYCSIAACSNAVLSTEEFKLKNSIVLHPNPTKNNFTIQIPDTIEMHLIKILDMGGRVLKTILSSNIKNEMSISLSNYTSGVYFIHMMADNQSIIKRIVKE